MQPIVEVVNMYSAASRSVSQTTSHLVARSWVRLPGRGVATLPLFSLEGKTCVGMFLSLLLT